MSRTGGWVWYELMTSDVAAALAFYGNVVGWRKLPGSTVEGYSMFAMGETAIGGMMAMPDGAPFPQPVWTGYIHVADADAAVLAAEQDDAVPCMTGTDIPEVGRIAMLLDPQGAPFYVIAPLPQDGQSESFAAKVGHCQWNELVTTDPAAALAFYVKHFGWEQGEVMSMGPLGDYQFVITAGVRSGAIMKRDRLGAPPLWRYYFGVDDIDRGVKAIVDGGGSMLGEPMPVPGGGFACVAVDPQGAEFGIAGPRKG